MSNKMNLFQDCCLSHFTYASIFIFILVLNCNEIIAQEMHAANSGPVYPGGKNALKEFINKNLRYPDEAKKSGISGVVELKFTINKKGEVENIKVMKGISTECDAEAIRVSSLITRWTPGVRQGKPVNTIVSFPIEFKGGNKTQPGVITGRVTEKNTGIPIEGSFVIIKGTNIGTITGPDGSYKLEITADSKDLECFGVGYSSETVPLDYHSTINIELDIEYQKIDL